MSVLPPAGCIRFKQFYRYLLTGGAAAIVDVGGFAFFATRGMGVAQAAILSFLTALIVNYFLSARFAFQQDQNSRSFLLFAGFAIGGLLINVGATMIAFDLLGVAIASKLIGIGVAFFFNFAVNALLVFN